jgi:hypothetical protein
LPYHSISTVMKNFIEVTGSDRVKHLLNINQICHICPEGNHTRIEFMALSPSLVYCMDVIDKYDDVKAMIAEALP